ncbi:MAG: glycine cleavage system protein GcvH [Gammaproteobacteria bacterium]|nr:glycine cleavage system protein GcvH [Gammaproteobacteria bacterium]
MNKKLEELKYTESHEWIAVEGDTITVGITEHAQEQLGDIVYVGIPEMGASFAAGDTAAVIESVKAASDIYAPLPGEVVAVNEELNDKPETVNSSPYADGWLFKLKVSTTESDKFMSLDDYKKLID